MSQSEIPLADVVAQLRKELQATMEAGEGEDLRFEVEDIEIEMQVVVTRGGSGELGGEGGVELWVIGKAGGKVSGSYESSQIHRVKLKLRPKTGDGKSGTVDLAG